MEGRFTVSAPTRVDLAGGTLDLWPLYCFLEGAKTINLALDLMAEVRFDYSASDRFVVELKNSDGIAHSFQTPPRTAECKKLDPSLRFPATVLSNYLSTRKDFPNVRIAVSWKTQAPIGSGLGGSSSLGVALLRGISRIFADYSDLGWQWHMLSFIRDVEAAFLETPTGTQDYLAALFGGASCFQSRAGDIGHAMYRSSTFDGLCDRVLVLFSGEQHHSGRTNWEVYKGAIEKDPSILRGLSGIRELAEDLDVRLRESDVDWRGVGGLLSAEWKLRRELFGVSTPRLDSILQWLYKLPILGAKVCGAAAGGSLLVLVDPASRAETVAEIERRGIQVLKTKPVPRGVSIA